MKSSIFKKRPVLNRPLVADSSSGDDGGQFFSRSNDVFKKRAAEEAARRLDEQRRSEAVTVIEDDEDRAKTCPSPGLDALEPEAASKRVLASPPDPVQNWEDDTQSTIVSCSPKKPSRYASSRKRKSSESETATERIQSPESASTQHERTAAKTRARHNAIDVDLQEDREESTLPRSPEGDIAATSSKPSTDEEHEVESDPELAEITKRAREKARRRRLQEDEPSMSAPGLNSPEGHAVLSPGQAKSPLGSPQKPEDDPVVQYLVTSGRPNTQPLIAARKFSQRLKEVRLQWCHDQGYTEDFSKSIMLTHRNQRVYDTTSCRGLGLTVAGGQVVLETDIHRECGRVHLVAWTIEDFEAAEKEKTRQAEAAEDQDYEEPTMPPEQKEESIKLVLRALNYDDFKVKARMHNPLSRILKAFRSTHGLGKEHDVFVVFDGERLDPESLISDHDLEDMDCLDVTIQ